MVLLSHKNLVNSIAAFFKIVSPPCKTWLFEQLKKYIFSQTKIQMENSSYLVFFIDLATWKAMQNEKELKKNNQKIWAIWLIC